MQKKEAKDMTYQRIHKMCRIFGWVQILLMWFPKADNKPAHSPNLMGMSDWLCNICKQSTIVEGKATRFKHLCTFCETQKNYFTVKNDAIEGSSEIREILAARSLENRNKYLYRMLATHDLTQGCVFNCDINIYIYIYIYT